MVRTLNRLGRCCLLWLACSSSAPKKPPEAIAVDHWAFGPGISQAADEFDLNNPELRHRLLVDAIKESRYFTDVAKSGDGWKTVIQLDQITMTAGGPKGLFLEWSMQTPASIRDQFSMPTVEIGVWTPIEDDLKSNGLTQKVRQALRQVMVVLDAHFDLASQSQDRSEHAAKQLFTSPNAELVMLGLNWVATKRVSSLAPQVVELLEHPNFDVAIAAVETLGSIGNPSHVPAIIHHLRLGDLGHAIRGYEVIAQLCGPEARSFLEFAVRNEDSAEGRNAAIRALENCRSRPIANKRQLREPLRGHRP